MRAQAARRRRVDPRGRDRSREFPRNQAVEETDIVRRGWWQHPLTTWKKPSCGASVASWNRRAWLGVVTLRLCNKWCARRKKWAVTILAHAARGRNSRSATGRDDEFRAAKFIA